MQPVGAMPKIKVKLEPERPPEKPDADDTPSTMREFITGRAGERRIKKRLRPPARVTGVRG